MPPGNMFGCDCSNRDSNPDPTFRKNVALPFELHGYFIVSNVRILSFLYNNNRIIAQLGIIATN